MCGGVASGSASWNNHMPQTSEFIGQEARYVVQPADEYELGAMSGVGLFGYNSPIARSLTAFL